MQTGTSQNNRLRNTKERDASLGLDNDGFRYYDPAAGRYLQRDPIGYGDGLNVYMSVHDDPINQIDPLGLSAWDTFKGFVGNAASSVATTAKVVGRELYHAPGTIADMAGLHGGEVAAAARGGFNQGAIAGYTNVNAKVAGVAAAADNLMTGGSLGLQQVSDQADAVRQNAWNAAGLSGTDVEVASNTMANTGIASLAAAGALQAGAAAGLTQLGEATSVGEFVATAKLEATAIAYTGGTGVLYQNGAAAAAEEGGVRTANSSFQYGRKIQNDMAARGWSDSTIDDVITTPHATSPALNKATQGEATAFFREDGAHVVRDNSTCQILQVSNRYDPNWIPDSTIQKPYRPK